MPSKKIMTLGLAGLVVATFGFVNYDRYFGDGPNGANIVAFERGSGSGEKTMAFDSELQEALDLMKGLQSLSLVDDGVGAVSDGEVAELGEKVLRIKKAFSHNDDRITILGKDQEYYEGEVLRMLDGVFGYADSSELEKIIGELKKPALFINSYDAYVSGVVAMIIDVLDLGNDTEDADGDGVVDSGDMIDVEMELGSEFFAAAFEVTKDVREIRARMRGNDWLENYESKLCIQDGGNVDMVSFGRDPDGGVVYTVVDTHGGKCQGTNGTDMYANSPVCKNNQWSDDWESEKCTGGCEKGVCEMDFCMVADCVYGCENGACLLAPDVELSHFDLYILEEAVHTQTDDEPSSEESHTFDLVVVARNSDGSVDEDYDGEGLIIVSGDGDAVFPTSIDLMLDGGVGVFPVELSKWSDVSVSFKDVENRVNGSREVSGMEIWEEERILCPDVWEPVCGEIEVQCVQAPCPPVRQTFGNRCEANKEMVEVVHEGECEQRNPVELIVSNGELHPERRGQIVAAGNSPETLATFKIQATNDDVHVQDIYFINKILADKGAKVLEQSDALADGFKLKVNGELKSIIAEPNDGLIKFLQTDLSIQKGEETIIEIIGFFNTIQTENKPRGFYRFELYEIEALVDGVHLEDNQIDGAEPRGTRGHVAITQGIDSGNNYGTPNDHLFEKTLSKIDNLVTRSYPHIKAFNPMRGDIANGYQEVYGVKISASTEGDVNLYSLRFHVETSGSLSFSKPRLKDKTGDEISYTCLEWSIIKCYYNGEGFMEIISAASSEEYYLEGAITDVTEEWDAIRIQMSGEQEEFYSFNDGTLAGYAYGVEHEDSAIVWNDVEEFEIDMHTLQWYGDYAVQGLDTQEIINGTDISGTFKSNDQSDQASDKQDQADKNTTEWQEDYPIPIINCDDLEADNYDSRANGNSMCIFSGCTDPQSSTYWEKANRDDGSCDEDAYGCTREAADNYDPTARVDDGSCIEGWCTDIRSHNYNHHATYDDGTCVIHGCTNPNADNYDPTATNEDDSCYGGSCWSWLDQCDDPATYVEGSSGTYIWAGLAHPVGEVNNYWKCNTWKEILNCECTDGSCD